MNINDVLTLAKAGFTADQIIKLTAEKKAEPAPAPEGKKEEPKKTEAPKEEPKTEETKNINEVVSEEIAKAFKPFEALYNNIAKLAGAPTLRSVEPKGIDDIISDFLKEE